MSEENISHKFRLKHIDKTRNYFIEEINQNELRSNEHLLILISTVTGCVFISAFAFLAGIPIGITSSTIGLKICVITAVIRKHKSIISKRKKEA